MAKFAISEIGIFLKLYRYIYLLILNLMQCLIVTILCCVDDHFTSFVAVLLLLTMVCSEFCPVICAVPRKTAYHVYRIGYRNRFFFSNKYRISKKHKNLISVHL